MPVVRAGAIGVGPCGCADTAELRVRAERTRKANDFILVVRVKG